MFEYFPGNYVWSTGVNIVLGNGGAIGEVDQACRPARDAAEYNLERKPLVFSVFGLLAEATRR